MKDALLFFGQIARRWRTIGAIAPSGGPLARVIARSVGEVEPGQVVLELGPGTGVITRELEKHFPRSRIVAVEVVDTFAERLGQAFPGVTVVQGCASQLDSHLRKLNITPDQVAGVVSGLPLLSLPGDLPQRILESVTSVLRPGRRYVQFTYSARAWRRFETPGFQRLAPQKVWRNVPPASVLTFAREG